jgi:hypothetical protein
MGFASLHPSYVIRAKKVMGFAALYASFHEAWMAPASGFISAG